MEEKLKIKFIPVCFQKDVINLSDHFKEKQKSENLVYREIPTNLNAKDKDGFTPLHLAVMTGKNYLDIILFI